MTVLTRAAIVAVGSELLTPSKLDTNSLHITEQLNRLGIDVVMKAVVGDSRDELAHTVRAVLERVDLLILCGGLGPTDDDDFNIMDPKDIANTLTGTTLVLTLLLAAFAAISLVVGVIGIMNIMLVSVTERTREIGTRLAIGALESEVLTQFLVESVVLSAFGGTVGILSALAVSAIVARALSMPFAIDYSVVLMAFLFSAAVGVVFGFFPARRAARLNPIDALRHE